MINQKQKVLDWLQSGRPLTRMIAMERLGIMNVTARIAELRNEGHIITPNLKTTVNRYGDKASSATWKYGGYSEPEGGQYELRI